MNVLKEIRYGYQLHSAIAEYTTRDPEDDRSMEDFKESMRILREVNLDALGGDIPKSQTLEVVQRTDPTVVQSLIGLNIQFNLEKFPPDLLVIDDILLTTPELTDHRNVKKIKNFYVYNSHPMLLAFSIGPAEDVNGNPINAYTMYRVAGTAGKELGKTIKRQIASGVNGLYPTGIVQIEEIAPVENFFSEKSTINPVLLAQKAETLARLVRQRPESTIIDFTRFREDLALERREARERGRIRRRMSMYPRPEHIKPWRRKPA